MLVIVPHLLIVGFQFGRIRFLIGVFAERDGGGEPGFQFILMRGVPERQTDYREGVLRKLKEAVHFLNVIPDAARVNSSESQSFKRGKGVLSLNRGIHAAHNQLLGPAEIRLRHEDLIAVIIRAEHPELRGRNDVLLIAGEFRELRLQFLIRDPDSRGDLQKAGGACRAGGFINRFEIFLAHRFISKGPD